MVDTLRWVDNDVHEKPDLLTPFVSLERRFFMLPDAKPVVSKGSPLQPWKHVVYS
jgi:hypothetical protein